MRARTFSGSGVPGDSRSWLRVCFTALVVLVTGAAMVAVAPSRAVAATRDNVPYLMPNGVRLTADQVTVLDGSTALDDLNGTLTSGWYLVTGTINYGSTITVSGDVHLILEDDSSLTATGTPGTAQNPGTAGIRVGTVNSLEIYAQATGDAMGRLSANGGINGAGIGGNPREAGGTITVNGGMVTATSSAFGAGIGGGYQGAGGTITINGGIVTATNTRAGGAAIGGGNGDAGGGAGGTITVNGGTVTATASNTGAGIGGGRDGGTTTINGGRVTATGGSQRGAGIGGGSNGGAGGTIVIGGGDVTARGGAGSAGIGGSRSGGSGAITISGAATVHATGGNAGSDFGGGAGIGSGGGFQGGAVGAVGTIIVDATDVTAGGGAGNSALGAGASIGFGGSSSGDGQAVIPGTTVTFHTVTVKQVAGGTITAFPQRDTGSVRVPEGGNQTFLIIPRPGFESASVTVDGTNVGVRDSWTIPRITADHTIGATFEGAGGLVPLTPARLMDTRRGLGASGPVGADTTIHLPVLGHGGVPASGVKAVVLNVTATAPTATSFVTVWAGGETRPGTSNLNFTAGQTVPNLVIAPVGEDGTVDFYNRAGTVQLVADVTGWFAAGSPAAGGLGTVTSDRLMDTRTGLGTSGPVGPGETVHLPVLGHGGVPDTGVGSVVLTVTVSRPSAPNSFVTVWPDGRPRPGTSNLNFTAGQTRANLVVVPVGPDGVVNFFNAAGDVQIVADVSGWFAAGSPPAAGGLGPLEPTRVLDTRVPGVGGFVGPVGPGETVHLPVSGHGGIPASGVEAVVLNVTATQPTATGFVTVWADGEGRPGTSNLNFTAGQTVANAVIAPVGADGKVDFFNSAGNTQLVADVSGWFGGPAS